VSKREKSKPYRAKVGDWLCTFVKVVASHGKHQIVVQIEGSEVTLNRSECWHPDRDEEIGRSDMAAEIFASVLPGAEDNRRTRPLRGADT
jgi:hypothetical protein